MAHDSTSETTDVPPPPPPPADTPDLDAEVGPDSRADPPDTADLDAGYQPELTNERDGYTRPSAAEVFAKYDEGGGGEHQPEFTHEESGYSRPTAAEVFEKYREPETPGGPDDVFGPGADKEYAPLEREEGQLPGDEVAPLFEKRGEPSGESPDEAPSDASDASEATVQNAGTETDAPAEDEPEPSEDESELPPDPPEDDEGTDPLKPSIEEVPVEDEPADDPRPDLTEAEEKGASTLDLLRDKDSRVEVTDPTEPAEPIAPATGPEVPGPPGPAAPDWFRPTEPPERPRRLVHTEAYPAADNGFELADSIVGNIGQLADGTALGTGSDAAGVGLAVAKGAVEFARDFETITDYVVGTARNLVNDLRGTEPEEENP